jgi:guanosine-3',5'-bis(diphosphate) 3'-pyrophosphohydrolase
MPVGTEGKMMILSTGATGPMGTRDAVQPSSAEAVGLLLRAIRFAAWKHRDQRRKGQRAEPYINHPLELAHVLWFEGGVRDEATLVAALLHDTLEDTQTTVQELQGEFGEEIGSIVMEVSDEPTLDWRVRKKLQVTRAKTATPRARLVKLADKICNLRSMIASPPQRWSIERRRAYFDWAREVVEQLRGTNPSLEERFDQVYRQRP